MSKFSAVIENLYQFHFRRPKAQAVLYAVVFVMAVGYALMNALILGRPGQSVVFESIVLTVILMVTLPIAYSVAVINPGTSAPEDRSINVSGPSTKSRSARWWDLTLNARKGDGVRPVGRHEDRVVLTLGHDNRQRPTATIHEPRLMETPMSDDELILRVKRDRDRGAYQDLYLRHSGRSLAICLRGTGKLPDAEDINQEVWIKVWRRSETFRDDGVFVAWLIVIAVSACRDWRRKQVNRNKVVVIQNEGQEIDSDEQLDWLAHQAEKLYGRSGEPEKIQRAWEQLSADEQEMLQQEYVDKRSRKDIATEMDVSAPTLRKRLAKVRETFRQYLLKEGVTLREEN
jgi:RNA polymerase sigma-70 factor (ECF subfamily)